MYQCDPDVNLLLFNQGQQLLRLAQDPWRGQEHTAHHTTI